MTDCSFAIRSANGCIGRTGCPGTVPRPLCRHKNGRHKNGRRERERMTTRASPAAERLVDRLGMIAWIAPAYVLMFAVTAYPLGVNLVQSFLGEAPLGQAQPFVGLKNYRTIVESPEFVAA